MRGSFQIKLGDAESEIARKLENGLNALGLRSQENLGLLLNLLGLKPPDGALAGLDGVLIGLRTRDLLHSLLQARCRFSQVVMMIEDLHWVDSVSQEVLEAIIEGNPKLGLVILHTRRPEYEPLGAIGRLSPRFSSCRFQQETSDAWSRPDSGLTPCPRLSSSR